MSHDQDEEIDDFMKFVIAIGIVGCVCIVAILVSLSVIAWWIF